MPKQYATIWNSIKVSGRLERGYASLLCFYHLFAFLSHPICFDFTRLLCLLLRFCQLYHEPWTSAFTASRLRIAEFQFEHASHSLSPEWSRMHLYSILFIDLRCATPIQMLHSMLQQVTWISVQLQKNSSEGRMSGCSWLVERLCQENKGTKQYQTISNHKARATLSWITNHLRSWLLLLQSHLHRANPDFAKVKNLENC